MPGIHLLVYIPGIHPWVHRRTPHGVPHRCCRTQGDRVAALRRTVAERWVTDGSLTVTRFTVGDTLTVTRFTVGRCCSHPGDISYGGGPLCAEWCPSLHPIVEECGAHRGVLFVRFDQQCAHL